MKKSTYTSLAKVYFLGLLATAVIFACTSCAKKISFQTSSVVPAARGTVKVKKDKNKNYHINVKLVNLAEANRLETSKDVYVIWMETDERLTKNLGRINSSSKMLSKKLKASFETVSSFKPIKIFITLENEADVQFPGSQLVLTTSNF